MEVNKFHYFLKLNFFPLLYSLQIACIMPCDEYALGLKRSTFVQGGITPLKCLTHL